INYRESFGLKACSGILFNHESPLRGPEFVTKKITTQLCEIKFGGREKLILGNLNAKRDWGYAKEYVKAMWLMLQQDHLEDYVIATGRTTSVREFVSFCCSELEIDLVWEGEGELEKGFDRKTNKLIIECNKDYYRPAEVDILIGSSEKAKKQLGWEAKTDVKSLASIMVNFDRKRLV
ncbi:MAG: GDP-mannose 4,6-dehydratase, partial [Pseudomonadota bacterium]|nr:GDP-mannose 4,6-dehydratase [Pseudomonadota bacterium]